ncbi:Hypothetical predicted protein [Scomber scombrus]|uniref:Uncharacterized protein n=1 Tax=Scomber scombrus TaxID=13677 RepID=A0AAV1PSV5_SCOSC
MGKGEQRLKVKMCPVGGSDTTSSVHTAKILQEEEEQDVHRATYVIRSSKSKMACQRNIHKKEAHQLDQRRTAGLAGILTSLIIIGP